MMRMAERAMAQARGRAASSVDRCRGSGCAGDPRGAHRREGADRQQPGDVRYAARVIAVMKLDLLLFGRIRSGPFFALLVKE